MINTIALQFNPSKLLCYPNGKAYENDKYRVVYYEYSLSSSMIHPYLHWKAYTLPNGLYVNGNTEYETKEQAIDACQKHFDNINRK
jgi:hypothetical protein